MLFLVRMKVNIPDTLAADIKSDLFSKEKEYSQRAQKDGKIAALWRVSGQFANYCLFDVDSNDELHELISNLPLFPYLDIEVTALNKHPNSIR